MKLKLRFLGAAQNVTGSRYLLESNGSKVLVDCGFYQERQFQSRNWDPFPVPAAEIDAVLLTHAHLDHCGLLPKLVREGFRGRIFCTDATAEIARIIIADSARIQEEDAEYKRKRHKREKRKSPRKIEPLYTVEDAEKCTPLFAPVPYDETVAVADGMEAAFCNVGHVLGSSAIRVTASQNGSQRSVVFSGDLGRWDKPILNDPESFEQADYVLCESTYGDRDHAEEAGIGDQLAEVINATHKAGGNIIIPSFALERAQELMYHLNELLLADRIPHMMCFVDSPMANRVTEVFKKHPQLFDEQMTERHNNHQSFFDFPGLQLVKTSRQSKAINHIKGTVIVIAGSGMCTGGRIKHHLVTNIGRPESTVMFVGYQAHGTLGRRIVQGEPEVRILGRQHHVKANVVRIDGFSAHGDRNEMLRWLQGLKTPPKHVFITHGEVNSAKAFGEFVNEKAGWSTSVPEYEDVVTLE